jgi:ABC-type oligopeptide transport system substrate-binding subunit
MHTKQFGTLILALTFTAGLSAACSKSGETPGTTGTTGNAVRVSQVTVGRSLNASKAISDATDSFKPNDTIYASVATEGSAATAALKARWTFQDGQVVDESTQTIAPSGPATTEFHISKPDGWPAGKYKVEVFLDGSSAGSKDFNVQR